MFLYIYFGKIRINTNYSAYFFSMNKLISYIEGLFFHAPYSVSNQSNKPVGNLEMCEIRVNTHTF